MEEIEEDGLELAPWKLRVRSYYHKLLESALGNQMVMYGLVLFVGCVLGGLAVGIAPRSAPPDEEATGDPLVVGEVEDSVVDEVRKDGDDDEVTSVQEATDQEAEGPISIAKMHLQAGEYQKTIESLREFVNSDIDHSEDDLIALFSCLVEAFRGSGDQDRARVYARKTWELVERGGEVVQRLKSAREAFDEGRYQEARTLFYRFLCLSGGSAQDFMPWTEEAYFRLADSLGGEALQGLEGVRDPETGS